MLDRPTVVNGMFIYCAFFILNQIYKICVSAATVCLQSIDQRTTLVMSITLIV